MAATAFSATKFAQPLPLNSTRSAGRPPLFAAAASPADPLKTIPSSSFLGSTHQLSLSRPSISPSSSVLHRSAAVVAVSEVVKEKKTKSNASLPNLFI